MLCVPLFVSTVHSGSQCQLQLICQCFRLMEAAYPDLEVNSQCVAYACSRVCIKFGILYCYCALCFAHLQECYRTLMADCQHAGLHHCLEQSLLSL